MDVTCTKRRQLHTDSYIWKKMIAVSRRSRMACFACVALVAVYLFVRDLLLYAYHNHKRVLATGLAVCLIIVSSFSLCLRQVAAEDLDGGLPDVGAEPQPIEPSVTPTADDDDPEPSDADPVPQINVVLEPKLPDDENGQTEVEPTDPGVGTSDPNEAGVDQQPSWDNNGTYDSAYITLSNLSENALSNLNIVSEQFDIVNHNGSYQLVVRPTDENGVPIAPTPADPDDSDQDLPGYLITMINNQENDNSCKIELALPSGMIWSDFIKQMFGSKIVDNNGQLNFEIQGVTLLENGELDFGDHTGEDLNGQEPTEENPSGEGASTDGDEVGDPEAGDAGSEDSGSGENSTEGEETAEEQVEEGSEEEPGTSEDTEFVEENEDGSYDNETEGEIEDIEGEENPEESEMEEGEDSEDSEEEAVAEEEIEEVFVEPSAGSVAVQRPNGCAMGGTFFAMGANSYHLVLAQGEEIGKLAISDVMYRYGSEEGVAAVVDGAVDIPIPEYVNDELVVYYYNANNEPVTLFSEYVVNEADAPLIHYERVNKNDIQYLHVTLMEKGAIKSGISDAQIMVDGEIAQLPLSNVLKSVELASGQSVPTILEYNVELGKGEEHEFEIVASDYAGNMNKKIFDMSALSTEIVSVVLPTTFHINLLPFDDDYQVMGEDIKIGNCSDFPINVSIDHTYVEVNRTPADVKTVEQTFDLNAVDTDEIYNLNDFACAEKNCNLYLELVRNDGQLDSYLLPEGDGEFMTEFELAEKSPDTDVEELKKPTYDYPVSRDDYACVRLRGTLESGSEALWLGGDLKVTLTFNFSKVGAEREDYEEIDENMIFLDDIMQDDAVTEPLDYDPNTDTSVNISEPDELPEGIPEEETEGAVIEQPETTAPEDAGEESVQQPESPVAESAQQSESPGAESAIVTSGE